MADMVEAYWDIATAIAWLRWRNTAVCRRVHRQNNKEFLDVDVARALEDTSKGPDSKFLTIAEAKDELLTALKAEKFKGHGVRSGGTGNVEEIHSQAWAFLRIYDSPLRAEPEYNPDGYSTSWSSVLFPSKDIQRLWPSTPRPRPVGGQEKYPWRTFDERVIEFLKKHGLPSPDKPEWRKVTLENLMDEWCDKNWPNRDNPGESTIRKHITTVMDAFEKGVKSKADK